MTTSQHDVSIYTSIYLYDYTSQLVSCVIKILSWIRSSANMLC